MSSDTNTTEDHGDKNGGSEMTDVDDEAYMPTYDEAFPSLPSPPVQQRQQQQQQKVLAGGGDVAKRPQPSLTSNGTFSKMAVKSSVITQVYHVPLEERRYREMNDSRFGEASEQSNKICMDIQKSTGAAIEISMAKDQSLTIVVTGKPSNVMTAKRELLNKLQTQANLCINIPKEHHRFILGKAGTRLKELEMSTATKVMVPRSEEKSDVIRITGPKEGIEKARHEIQLISEEQSKLAFERLKIEKCYHPFILGANSENIKEIMEKTSAKIHVPPPSVMKDEIIVSGEKEGVAAAIASIMSTYEEKKRKTATVSLEVRKSQHKYIIGQKGNGLQEILATTGVWVEVPSLDSTSETITLRGEQDRLGPAITQVYAKANSITMAEVKVAPWLHKFIIGRNGKNIKNITQNLPKVNIEFEDGKETISVEGPPEEVEMARKALEEIARDLENKFSFVEMNINPKYHRYIIGKSGANISRIKQETGVSIRIPSEDNASWMVRIEGSPEGVKLAKKELGELVTKMENERSKDMVIEHRFHKNIIGARGEKIKAIRDKFEQVTVSFPESSLKSDVVTLRGPKQELEMCYKYLSQIVAELVANNYKLEIPIFKKFHKNVIGKGGATITKIKDETGTRIEIPSEDSNSDLIVIVGKKASVEKARSLIQEIQKELANVVQMEVSIPHKLHQSLIGAKGRLIRSIMEDCGGVSIHFPSGSSESDKVTIRGPKEDVEKAKKQLTELANEKEKSSHMLELDAKPEYHKFLIGRQGSNVRKLRDQTNARIIFPTARDENKETIIIMGTKEAVQAAKVELEKRIKDLDNITEEEVVVDPKYHRHFVARRGEVLHELAEDFGGVQVSFPKSGSKKDKVTVKGAKDCVEGAKKKILEIVNELESQVTIECVIPQHHHRSILGNRGTRVQAITSEFKVGIKFPDRAPNSNQKAANGEAAATVNGDDNSEASNGSSEELASPRKTDVIQISGQQESCDKAKQALLDLVPITKQVDVPFDLHRFIIGKKGDGVRHLMETCDVNFSIPPTDKKLDTIDVHGPLANVEAAIKALGVRMQELEEEKQERQLRSFQLKVTVDPKYHPKIIGFKGTVISKIRAEVDVNVQFPDKNSQTPDQIIITGYQEKTKEAEKKILAIVKELEDQIVETCQVDHRIHSRLIGNKGKAIRRVMDNYKVDIRFPRGPEADPDLVTIQGMEENVLDAKDYILNIAEEYMQEIVENEYMQKYLHPASKESDGKAAASAASGFSVRDAPWNKPPDTSNTTDFPAIGGRGPAQPNATTATATAAAPLSSWGPGQRR